MTWWRWLAVGLLTLAAVVLGVVAIMERDLPTALVAIVAASMAWMTRTSAPRRRNHRI